jgi:hypothetical protein
MRVQVKKNVARNTMQRRQKQTVHRGDHAARSEESVLVDKRSV